MDKDKGCRTVQGRAMTKELADEVLGYIRSGLNLKSAGMAAGYSREAVGNWQRVGKRPPPGREDDPYVQACVYLYQNIPTARARCKHKLVSSWHNSQDWKAQQAMLETLYPGEWGHRVRMLAMVVDAMIAVRDKDIGKLMKMFGSAKSKTLMKLLQSFNLIDDAKPSVDALKDDQLAAIAEKGLAEAEANATTNDKPL